MRGEKTRVYYPGNLFISTITIDFQIIFNGSWKKESVQSRESIHIYDYYLFPDHLQWEVKKRRGYVLARETRHQCVSVTSLPLTLFFDTFHKHYLQNSKNTFFRIPQTLYSEFHKHFGNRYRTNAIKKIFHKRFIPISIIIPWTFTLVSSKIFAIAIAILSVQITFHSITFLQ